MMFLISLIFLLDLTKIALSKIQDSEPVYSRFDYEEKLLTKTVRLEYMVEDLVKNLNELETKFNDKLEKHRHDNERLDTNLKEPETSKKKEGKNCPESYMYNAEVNLCWRLQRSIKLNWFDAEKECSKQGARLMILNTTSAVNVIQTYLAAVGAGSVYVGASDMLEEGTFKWTNGEVAGHISWDIAQPNGHRAQNCLAMEKNANYKFNDIECASKYELLCQYVL